MNKVIIFGGRDFKDYDFLSLEVSEFLKTMEGQIQIVCGGQISQDDEGGECWGADYLGECFARNNYYGLRVFKADWQKHGKSAGPIRNNEMAQYATHAIGFWDKKSRGTKDMIDKASKHGLILKVVNY